MHKSALLLPFKLAKRHIATQDRYRFYPLYSALIAALIYTSRFWPYDEGILDVWYAHPWIIVVDLVSLDIALWLIVSLGTVSLFRDGWISKIVVIPGMWFVIQYYYLYWNPVERLYTEVTWYLFDVPNEWISTMANGNRGAETTLWACVLLLVWPLVRPLVKIAYRRIHRLEGYVVSRWPTMARLSRPVI